MTSSTWQGQCYRKPIIMALKTCYMIKNIWDEKYYLDNSNAKHSWCNAQLKEILFINNAITGSSINLRIHVTF